MTTPADRLTTLEIRFAEQERVIEELSAEVAAQWKIVEQMQKRVELLTQRLQSVEDNTAPDVPVTRPPHW
jgi:SlyX protein